MVHRIRHPLSRIWPSGLLRIPASRGALLAFALIAAFGTSQLGCSGPREEGESALAGKPVTNLRLDGRVESLTDSERLESLYLPNTPPESERHMPLQTDGRGRAQTRISLPASHCLNALLESDADGAGNELALRVRTASSEQVEGRTLAVSRAHSTALPLAGLCPTSADSLPLEIELRGDPNTAYHLRLYFTESDVLERGLFAQGRRDLPGFQPYGPLQSDTLAANQRGSFPLAVTPDRCIAVVAYSEEELSDIDARFVSLTGEPLALEVATDRAAVLGPYCPYDPEVIRVEFRAYEGQGRFRWQVWDSPNPVGRRLLEGRQRSATGAISAALQRELQEASWPARRTDAQRREPNATR